MKIYLTIVLMALALTSPAFPDNPAPSGDAQVVSAILTRYAELVEKRGWISEIDGNGLRAFRFRADYDEIRIRVTSAKNDRITVFTADFTKNNRSQTRHFNFETARADFAVNAQNAVNAHLLSLTLAEDVTNRGTSPYFGWFSGGYHRVRDTREIYPEKNEGGYYLGMSIAYDPSRLTERASMPLRFGDYLTIDMWTVIDTNPEGTKYINENFFNIDLIFYGTHRFNRTGQSTSRFVYGFYTGMEYFRPGWKDNVLLWSHHLYRDQPHIQYMIWRAVGWGFTGIWNTSAGTYSAYFMAGLGPAINSSLFAIDLDEQEELDRSPIFQSLTGSKQNYYYSTAYPVSAVLTAERVWRLRLSLGYNFCYFYASDPAIKGEHAWDTLQIIKPSAGFYLADNLMLNFNYERWYIDSTLNGDHTSHVWNRFVAELRYIVQ